MAGLLTSSKTNLLRSVLSNIIVSKNFNSPLSIKGLVMWYDASDISTITKAFRAITTVATASGSSGTKTVTTSANTSAELTAGMRIRLNGTDVYTISTIVTTTITTVENLTTNYTNVGIELDGGSQWNDKSPSGYNLTSATSNLRPAYNATGLNSKPTFHGDGAGTLFSKTISATYPGITVLTVNQSTSATPSSGEGVFASSTSNSTAGSMSHIYVTNSQGVFQGLRDDGSSTGQIVMDSASGNTSPSIHVFTISGNNVRTYKNGAAVSNTTLGNVLTPTFTIIRLLQSRSGSPFQGNLSEVVVYNRVLSVSERKSLIAYEGSKWGITVT